MATAHEQPPQRASAIARLIRDIHAARAAGREVDESALVAAHPQLMPDLASELEKLQRLRATRAGAAARNETTAAMPPALSDVVAADVTAWAADTARAHTATRRRRRRHDRQRQLKSRRREACRFSARGEIQRLAMK